MTRCGSERHSNQSSSPPNTIDAIHEKSTPLVARETGPWNSDTPPYSNTHPATSPTSSAASERQRMSPQRHVAGDAYSAGTSARPRLRTKKSMITMIPHAAVQITNESICAVHSVADPAGPGRVRGGGVTRRESRRGPASS